MPTPTAGRKRGNTPESPRRTRNDPRRETTPRRLAEAARVVFERDGFYNARLSDISAEAKVASGTLYNYYRSKHDLLHEVMKDVSAELTTLAPDHVSTQLDPAGSVEEVNRAYIDAFQRNVHVLRAVYQARDDDDRLKAQWHEVAEHFQGRVTRAISRWQAAGLAYPDLDPRHTAHALTLMVERMVMAWTYEGADYDREILLDTINKIWERSLGLPERGTSPASTQATSA
ncbi:DNA-binding transcriptional regulator, AcrR family [Parafrankia irregularis]|uniref:DNA-binding transcriptional regulator, AcrR family n=1 Tax=Parafrankia irregularis TaxID=795642 RepID=A0A0S4QRW0_9ACTN|nr:MULTISPECIES: TetR/AcrR family transcriptional regulator [Parafrankia]MBE3199897.1 TetR/AcrR family transcriptional regulator [Parafrankia sp. CH37]CUU58052.1 DNA-binding transcriptional regulator, AcrR family [Parafrankia irregularis]